MESFGRVNVLGSNLDLVALPEKIQKIYQYKNKSNKYCSKQSVKIPYVILILITSVGGRKDAKLARFQQRKKFSPT